MSSTLSFPSKLGNSRPSSALQRKIRWRHRLETRARQICCIVVWNKNVISPKYMENLPKKEWLCQINHFQMWNTVKNILSSVSCSLFLPIDLSLHLYFLSSFCHPHSDLPGVSPCFCLSSKFFPSLTNHPQWSIYRTNLVRDNHRVLDIVRNWSRETQVSFIQ